MRVDPVTISGPTRVSIDDVGDPSPSGESGTATIAAVRAAFDCRIFESAQRVRRFAACCKPDDEIFRGNLVRLQVGRRFRRIIFGAFHGVDERFGASGDNSFNPFRRCAERRRTFRGIEGCRCARWCRRQHRGCVRLCGSLRQPQSTAFAIWGTAALTAAATWASSALMILRILPSERDRYRQSADCAVLWTLLGQP